MSETLAMPPFYHAAGACHTGSIPRELQGQTRSDIGRFRTLISDTVFDTLSFGGGTGRQQKSEPDGN